MLLSAGGLRQSDGRWIPNLRIRRSEVMWRLRFAIVTYLQAALRSGLLDDGTEKDIEILLHTWERRWWSNPCRFVRLERSEGLQCIFKTDVWLPVVECNDGWWAVLVFNHRNSDDGFEILLGPILRSSFQ